MVDPPWLYEQKWSRRKPTTLGAASRYDCLTLEQIAALDVGELAEPDAHLYLWTTNAFMEEAHRVARAWGFRPLTILTWVKGGLGTGFYFRNNTEHALFCTRGKLPLLRRDLGNVIQAPRLRHSQKPPAFFDLVESASPGPYVEVFGRAMARLGWIALGNEVGKGGDIRDAIRELAA